VVFAFLQQHWPGNAKVVDATKKNKKCPATKMPQDEN
jgi:hypothetical protein